MKVIRLRVKKPKKIQTNFKNPYIISILNALPNSHSYLLQPVGQPAE